MNSSSKALWLASLQRYENNADDPDIIHKPFPIMPWVTPCLNRNLLEIIEKLGFSEKFEAGETIFSYRQPVNKLVVVKSGIVSRCINSPNGDAIAISTPKHIACGNLNFFTQRPCFGKYTSLTDTELIFCQKEMLAKVCFSDAVLRRDLIEQFELCTLSDRLAFSCYSLLSAEDCLKAFSCTWAINYGKLDPGFRPGEDWIKMPYPLTRQQRALVICSSNNWVDKKIRDWRLGDLWHRKGNYVWFRPALLEEIYCWLRDREEIVQHQYPKNLLYLFKD